MKARNNPKKKKRGREKKKKAGIIDTWNELRWEIVSRATRKDFVMLVDLCQAVGVQSVG
jgi:hypothetical protein